MDGFQHFIQTQVESMKLMNQRMIQMQEQIENLSSLYTQIDTISSKVPLPKPLNTKGNMLENFELFKLEWESYMKATGLDIWKPEEEQKKIDILLSVIGNEAKDKYGNFDLTVEDKSSAANILQKVKEKVFLNSNVINKRWQFHTCSQLSNETFDNYLLRLSEILDKCQFESIPLSDLKNIILRDRIIFGVQNQELKNKFLVDDPEKLKLDDVINACKINDINEEESKQINTLEKSINDSINDSEKLKLENEINTCKIIDIDKKKSERVNTEEKTLNKFIKKKLNKVSFCKFCNEKHILNRNYCSALQYYCTKCKKRGHFEITCTRKFRKNEKNIVEMKQNENNI